MHQPSPPQQHLLHPEYCRQPPKPAWLALVFPPNSATGRRRQWGQGAAADPRVLRAGWVSSPGGAIACGSPAPLARGWRREGVGRGLTYPDRRVQVGHSHLLRTLHGLDHLLLVLWGEKSASTPGDAPADSCSEQGCGSLVSSGDGAKPACPARPKAQGLGP